MKKKREVLLKRVLFVVLTVPFISCSQQVDSSIVNPSDSLKTDTIPVTAFYDPVYYNRFHNQWVQLENGLEYIEKDASTKARVGDSRISVLKINPEKFKFELLSASQFDSTSLCVNDWAEKFNLSVVINAGMYDLKRQLSSKGLLQNNLEYANNGKLYEGYNMMIAFNPLKEGLPEFDIIDLKCTDFSTVQRNYASLAQGMRMIDCSGNPMSWNKNPQWCSQLIVAKDKHQFIYFIFTRSPYSHNEMIDFMVNFEEPLLNAIYMEGGPQTSLFIDTKSDRIEKLGSYVSKTYATDKNSEFWGLPNVIGIRKK